MPPKKQDALDAPRFRKRSFPEPKTLIISEEAWSRPGVRVAACSRPFWKHKGARTAILEIEPLLAVRDGCHYIVYCGGLVDKKYIERKVNEESDRLASENSLTRSQRGALVPLMREHVLDEMARELHSILPRIQTPASRDGEDTKKNGVGFVRYYVMTSPVLDGRYGDDIVKRLMKMRSDIRLLKQGQDHTYLKGVAKSGDEKVLGQVLGWLTPRKHRLPGQYASNSAEKEIREADAAVADKYPAMWVVGGFGDSVSKPGGGERKRPFISLPVSYVPVPSSAGEPSVTLNQIGMRIIEADINGEEKLIRTWSLRDLVKEERKFIKGIKTGSGDLHRKIVDLLKFDRLGLHIGQIADHLGMTRGEVEEAVQFLIEPKASTRITWPGLYRDEESDRINFHLDWLQERLHYPWPYDEGYLELRRLIFGCLHAGYNTTDYDYVRYKFPEIIKRFDIEVVELVGDVTAGLKYHLIHRGQIISALNYTEQGIFAAELLGTVFYDVFAHRFIKGLGARNARELSEMELAELIIKSLLLFIYIVGNHEAWQKENGHTPCVEFKAALISLLNHHIGKFLQERGVSAPRLEEIVISKIIELPEYNAVYEFPGGLRTELFHPSMARTKTASIRLEEALAFSKCQMVDVANFHTAINIQRWEPDDPDEPEFNLGQREANQAGAMCVWTEFENGKLKRIDFGPVYSRVQYKDGRIFMSEHQFFNNPIMKKPFSVHTDVNQLKNRLGLLRSPYVLVER